MGRTRPFREAGVQPDSRPSGGDPSAGDPYAGVAGGRRSRRDTPLGRLHDRRNGTDGEYNSWLSGRGGGGGKNWVLECPLERRLGIYSFCCAAGSREGPNLFHRAEDGLCCARALKERQQERWSRAATERNDLSSTRWRYQRSDWALNKRSGTRQRESQCLNPTNA